jgi:prephenate dehydrogenase
LALLGTGYMGGSVALALRAAGRVQRIRGFDIAPGHAESAVARGIIDEIAASAVAAVEGADVVLVGVPVRSIAALVVEIAPALAPDGVVTDLGSTKRGVVEAADAAFSELSRFVGGHPLAGAERSGPEAADAGLFQGRICFLTPTARTKPDALARVEQMWAGLGAQVRRLDAQDHDILMGVASHLPHAVAYALAGAVAGGPGTRGLTAGGFRDTTRIASSDPVMWRDIFLENRGPVLAAIDRFSAELAGLRALVEREDGPALLAALERLRGAREWVLG